MVIGNFEKNSSELISVVIVNYNGERFIKSCLDSILNSIYPNFEIIVVDNNSKDKSAKILEMYKNNPRVKLILSDKNLQFAGGNNLGILHSSGNIIVFLNFDTIVDSKWLTELKRVFDSNSSVSAVQSLLMLPDKKTINTLGGTIDYCAKLVPAPYFWALNTEAHSEKRLFYGCGAALAVRKRVLEKVGVFDSDLPTDEVDLCWRINLQGGHIVLATKSIVYHFCGGAFGKGVSKQRVYFAELCALSAIIKNFSLKQIFVSLCYYGVFSILAISTDFIIRRRAELTTNRFKAYRHVFRSLPNLLAKRVQVQKFIRVVSDDKLKDIIVRPNLSYLIWSKTFLSNKKESGSLICG